MNKLGTNELVKCFRRVADGWREERKKYIMADKNKTNVCIYCRVGSHKQLTYEKTKPAIIAKDCKVKSSGKANA